MSFGRQNDVYMPKIYGRPYQLSTFLASRLLSDMLKFGGRPANLKISKHCVMSRALKLDGF